MKLIYLLILTLSSSAFGQGIDKLIMQSPDKNFTIYVTSKEIGDLNTECKYWLVSRTKDTVLLTTSILHDMPAPVFYWNKLSTKLIYEEQTYDTQEIRIYDLIKKKLIFKTAGFIWGHSMEYFDQSRGIVIFLRNVNTVKRDVFELLSLNIDTKETKLISTVKTSGDPYTGSPEIQTMNRVKNELKVIYQSESYTTEELLIKY